jgi:8-oxo-dGTP pyrophosphatase MutT (NUDIX family)
MNAPVLDVFQPGLKRGAARLAHAPHKRYFYVEHPTEGWRVYLRAATFIHQEGADFDPTRFLVVKKTGGSANADTWEPPKGQMEAKDTSKEKSVRQLLKENVYREVEEEAKISSLKRLRYTGMVYQNREPDYPDNHFFQYHVFQAFVTLPTIKRADEEFEWLNSHPKIFERLRKDRREKDALAWYNPRKTGLMGRWSPTIVAGYIGHFS